MSLEYITATYGYWALLFGTFFEGETIVVMGGLLANFGYLDLPLVILVSFIGSLIGDQFYFFIGRYKGKEFLSKRPLWKARSDKIQSHLDRYRIALMIGFRFMYGFRNIIPLMFGASRVKTSHFFVCNVIGAMVWAITIGTGGYLFGEAFGTIIGDIKRYQYRAFSIVIVVGAVVWLVYFYRRKKQKLLSLKPAEKIQRLNTIEPAGVFLKDDKD